MENIEKKEAYYNYYFMKDCRTGKLDEVRDFLIDVYNNPVTEVSQLPYAETAEKVDGQSRSLIVIPLKDRFSCHYDKALIWACSEGQLGVVKYLLTNNDFPRPANIEGQDSWALKLAVKKNHMSVVQYLLNTPNIINNSKFNINSLLISACESNKLDMLKFLLYSPELKNHIDYNKVKIDGFRYVCHMNKIEFIDYFINHPHNPIKENTQQDFAFKMAYRGKDRDMLNYLIVNCGLQKSKYTQRYMDKKAKRNTQLNLEIDELFEQALIYNKIQQQIENKPTKVTKKRKV